MQKNILMANVYTLPAVREADIYVCGMLCLSVFVSVYMRVSY